MEKISINDTYFADNKKYMTESEIRSWARENNYGDEFTTLSFLIELYNDNHEEQISLMETFKVKIGDEEILVESSRGVLLDVMRAHGKVKGPTGWKII